MALKYYSCLSEWLDGDLFILLPNLLVYVKVCGLACDFSCGCTLSISFFHSVRLYRSFYPCVDGIVCHFNGCLFSRLTFE